MEAQRATCPRRRQRKVPSLGLRSWKTPGEFQQTRVQCFLQLFVSLLQSLPDLVPCRSRHPPLAWQLASMPAWFTRSTQAFRSLLRGRYIVIVGRVGAGIRHRQQITVPIFVGHGRKPICGAGILPAAGFQPARFSSPFGGPQGHADSLASCAAIVNRRASRLPVGSQVGNVGNLPHTKDISVRNGMVIS